MSTSRSVTVATAGIATFALLASGCSGGTGDRTTQRTPGPTYVAPAVARAHAARRPNLLVITADDMRADDLRWMPQTRRQVARTGLMFRTTTATDTSARAEPSARCGRLPAWPLEDPHPTTYSVG